MTRYNATHQGALAGPNLTLGLMKPVARQPGQMADLALEQEAARLADRHGISALWARDVPLMVPQDSAMEAVPLDDPFLWLAMLGVVTARVALGTAAAVLPLRDPLHLAKSALSLDRLTNGRLILGLGSGDRDEEFAAFGSDWEQRAELLRSKWPLLQSALSPDKEGRQRLLDAKGGYDVTVAPPHRIPVIVIGAARQSLQWIAEHADGWASYHRPELRQRGRLNLWAGALRDRSPGQAKPSVQSIHLNLLEDPCAAAEPIELGMRVGRNALVDYLIRMEALGIGHVMLHLARSSRPALDVVEELGGNVLPMLKS